MNYAVLALASAFALGPILVILWTALTPGAGSEGGLGVFAQAWQEANFSQYMAVSLLVAVVVVTVAGVASLLAGFALGAIRFRASGVWFGVFLFGLMIPAEAIVVPLFFDLRELGLTDTLWAVALPQIAQSIAFGTYWMRAYFRAAPVSLIEAATLYGASTRHTQWRWLAPRSGKHTSELQGR